MAYDQLVNSLQMNFNKGNGITRDDFKNGYCIFAIDLRPSKCIEDINPIQTGHIQILLKFKEKTKKILKSL